LLKHLKNIASDSSSGTTENWYVTAERAEGVVDKDLLSRSDPYLKIEFGGKHVRTRTIKNDRSPCWNETFNFKLNSANAKQICLTLKDDDFGLDDTIGTATISRADLPSYPGEEKCLKIPVTRKEQVGAIVHLRVKLGDGQLSSSRPTYQTNVGSSQYPQQPQISSQPQHYSGPPNQPYNVQSNNPPIYNAPYTQPQQGYNQPQPSSHYNQTQQPFNNNQAQQPYYNQNPNIQGQAPPMMNQQFQSQPQPPPPHYQPQSNINYPSNQYQQRPY